jgi:hypothetical protein
MAMPTPADMGMPVPMPVPPVMWLEFGVARSPVT